MSERMNIIEGEQQREDRVDEGRKKVKLCDTDGINSVANKCLGFGSLEALKSLQLE
jgi:nicotinamide riboside kinase